MGGIKRLFKSSKVLIAIAGILAAIGVRYLGLEADVAKELSLEIVGLAAALIAAIAWEDGAAKKNGNGGTPKPEGGAK